MPEVLGFLIYLHNLSHLLLNLAGVRASSGEVVLEAGGSRAFQDAAPLRGVLMKRLFCAVAVVMGLLPVTPASAGGGVGAGVTCDPGNPAFCVTTQVAAVGAGSTVTGGQVAAVCEAETTGALLTSVTCSTGGNSRTVSLPGPYGASAVTAPTSSLTGHQVCWSSTGFFTDPLGDVVAVTDSGCSIVTI